MKIYSKTQLKNKATNYFEKHPSVRNVYVTSDGYLFLSKNRAEIHAGKLQTVYEFANEGNSLTDITTLNLPEASKLIKSLESLDELQRMLKAENVQEKPRKTVATLLEKRIVELQNPK